MRLTKASILLLSCLAVLCLISGCSSKEPDFIGYVYHKDKENKTTLVLGIAFDKRSTALIRSGVTSLEVGTKVEVYYQTQEMDSPFPPRAPARLVEIKSSPEETVMLQTLFAWMKENKATKYPAIGAITEGDAWSIEVMDLRNEEFSATFVVSKNLLSIELQP